MTKTNIMHKFKIGDKVQVIKSASSFGKEGFITDIKEFSQGIIYKVGLIDSYNFWFYEPALALAEPARKSIDLENKLEEQAEEIVKLKSTVRDLSLELSKYKPKSITKTVYFYRNDRGNIFSLGHLTVVYPLIAVKEITFTEGEGLTPVYDKE
jgi:hypothetical protein